MTDVLFTVAGGVSKKLKDMSDGTHAECMTVVGLDGDVTMTGDVVVDTLGALNDAKVTNPDAASATIPALLRGILRELQLQTTLLTTIASNTA
jgi:hypothetical protein